MKKLSIVIPMFNIESYLPYCLNSIVNQELNEEEYEIILINDGSTDNTLSVAQKYQREYSNIIIIESENKGVSYARNLGIQSAKGEYLFFIDGDDYLAKSTLKTLLDKVANIQIDMLFFELKLVNNYDDLQSDYQGKELENIRDGITYFSQKDVNNGPCHFIINRNFIINNNLYFKVGRFCEDGMFLIDCIFKAKTCTYMKYDVYRYVRRKNSTTTSKSPEHRKKVVYDFLYTVEYINQYCLYAQENGYSDEFIYKLENRRNSYIFFMQARMLKAGLSIQDNREIISKLKIMNLYPYKRISKQQYPLKRYSVMHVVFNKEIIFIFGAWLIKNLVKNNIV